MKYVICLLPFLIVTGISQNTAVPTQNTAVLSTNQTKETAQHDHVWNEDMLEAERSAGNGTESEDVDNASKKCIGPGAECVPYYLCDSNQTISDGFGFVDIRVTENPDCPSYLDVCCSTGNKTNKPVIEPPALTTQGCGYRNFDGIGFHIREKYNETQFGEFPWMAAVLQKEQLPQGIINVYVCGGSLIHSRIVLTAAHCVAGKANNILRVRVGEWDTQTRSEILPHQDRDVVEVRIHENYKSKALWNDVALVFLDSPVTFEENVKTVCLPPPETTFDYRRCFVTGWGKDKFGKEGRYQAILKKIAVPVVPHDVCQNLLRSTQLSEYFQLHESFLCAGGEEDKDACKGDGGSPLICPDPLSGNRYYQAGIVAWGVGCAENSIPGVYVNVPLFRLWIDNVLKGKGYNQSSYIL